MKTFFISNYATSGTNPQAVSISNANDVPEDYTGKRADDLAPTDELLERYHTGAINNEAYADEYVALLTYRNITPQTVADQFDDGTVFVCYDYEDGSLSDDDADNGDTKVCHRYLLADWLRASGVVEVTEI